ncbi:hypothetical protein [Paenibacillus sp. CF384]|uniref:hypothetical protein n=1 Tax=Paenibacillus sp. CF384 TaxID=1884382 RepID=UPI000894F419|nr:hypothetical protein [Paenibacillus sp. CF384]SDW04135.1 hypothetical protein SAMN05518855_100156 [Paenibacillus sp. CF384]
MDVIMIIVGVTVFLLVAVLIIRTNRWKTVLTAPGNQAEEIQDKHAYLHGRGIRSRIRELEGSSASTGIVAGTMHARGSTPALKLQVHKDDVQRAKEALMDYTHVLHTSHSPLV